MPKVVITKYVRSKNAAKRMVSKARRSGATARVKSNRRRKRSFLGLF